MNTINKIKRDSIFKRVTKYAIIILVLGSLLNCHKNDDDVVNSIENQLLGKWEVTGGTFLESQPKYLIFNSNNTVNFLSEHSLGFKANENFDYTVSGSEIKINVQGFFPFEFILEQNTLQIIHGDNALELTKNNSAPTSDDWVKKLSILSKGDPPSGGKVDIAFTYNKTEIVYGMGSAATYISLIDPETFTEVGSIETTKKANVVEVENFGAPDRYLFQSDDNSNLVSVYTMNDGAFQFTLQVDDDISGMASANSDFLWVVSNNNEGSINLVNVADNTIDQSISLGYYNLYGMDYQNNYIYITDGKYLHKCQTTPTFKAVTSYEVSDFAMQGIAFDGTNFWASGFDDLESDYKLVKTNLTL
tara:strand:- start:155 stop:1237 length:1083 start_codon:yes stop_codon:yes gene_type:complete